jgi:hypothetical protein
MGSWTYVKVPPAVTEAFGKKGRVPVKGSVNGVELVGSMMPDGAGGHFVVVKKELREKAKAAEGERVKVELSLDEAKRQVDVPPALKLALQNNKLAKAAFDQLSYSHQSEYAAWIADAKKAETKVARAEKAIEMLRLGKRLKG